MARKQRLRARGEIPHMPASIRPFHEEVLQQVRARLGDQAAKVVPWFIQNMPDYYFRTHSGEEQVRHLCSIISGLIFSERQTIALKSPCETRITYISPGSPEALASLLQKHVHTNIDNARFYSSLDGTLQLNTLLLAPQPRPDKRQAAFKHACAQMCDPSSPSLLPPAATKQECARFLLGASLDYVEKFEPARAARHYRLLQELQGEEDARVTLETPPQWRESRISIALNDPPRFGLLLQMVKALQRQGVQVRRGYADTFLNVPRGASSAGIISFYVCCADGKPLDRDAALWKRLKQELLLTQWLFAKHDLEIFADKHGWPLKRVMLLLAGAEFAHQFLIKQNLWAFTADNINQALLAHPERCAQLVEYFEARFAPTPLHADAAVQEMEKRLRDCLEDMEHEIPRLILQCILSFFKHTLRTNYFMEAPHGLCFRLDPVFLERAGQQEHAERPYGVYFYHGPYAQGFHVRYREMARGGLRVVTTRTQEQFELESNRLFDEVTKLALAQQLKNKDIPEGGAKGVLLLGPEGDVDRGVKGMVDAMMDCFLSGPEGYTLPEVRDYLGKEEIIYLGPDEHITPEHVNWMVERAAKRGYAWPSTIMSSKPEAGINHKEYGVTSLGVIVFAEEILRFLGIDPFTRPFDVTFTGGPRGDVAGNAVKLLIKRYGGNARILTMADGHGCAYDPRGLDHQELLRLIHGERPITDFDKKALSGEKAFVAPADTAEGVRLRTNLHNTVEADLFIPAGGRPDTINMRNWHEFLAPDKTPRVKAIVEGANIFIANEARNRLQEAGCLIVHGSSANKTGVICSSYEILAGLVTTEPEFLAIKKRYVAEVLEILRKRAGDEARLMLREYRRLAGAKPLTAITLHLSQEINKVSDALNTGFCEAATSIKDDDLLRELYFEYCPAVLVERYPERLLNAVPLRHQYALIAAHAAAHIVYAEGVGWLERVSHQREAGDVVRAYLQQEINVNSMLNALRKSKVRGREDLERILRVTGRKFLTKEALGLE